MLFRNVVLVTRRMINSSDRSCNAAVATRSEKRKRKENGKKEKKCRSKRDRGVERTRQRTAAIWRGIWGAM